MKNHQGLTPQQVLESRDKHGANTITPPPRTPAWKLLLEKFQDPMIKILLMAAVLSLGIAVIEGGYAETIGIFVAIALATGISFYFELDASKKFDLLGRISGEVTYKVMRAGELTQVLKSEIVVGDVILLDSGEEIPADGTLLEATALLINESTLTGEPSIRKTTDKEDFKSDATYPSDMLLRGTTVLEGNATYEVTCVGDNTQYGQVAREATTESGQQTPLSRQLEKLSRLVGVVGFSLASVTFIGLVAKHITANPLPLGQLGLFGAAIFGAFIMLGKLWIPMVFDARELLGSKRKRSDRFQKIPAISWVFMGISAFLGIAILGLIWGVKFWEPTAWVTLDYAGEILQYFMVAVALIVMAVPEGLPMSVTLSLALSMRKMLQSNNLVRKMHASETMGATTVICTDKTGTLTQNQMSVNQMKLVIEDNALIHKAIAVNSTANLSGEGKPLGNPTEGALLLWLNDQKVDYKELRAEVVEQLPFSSKIKMMATIAKLDGKTFLFVKGAPEYVTKMCQNYDKETIEQTLLEYQNRAMRTLAFAVKEITELPEELTTDWLVAQQAELQAITAIADPVRADVPDAVAHCMKAGIEVKMITGDTPATAIEIGRQIGLWNESDTDECAITGPEWEALSDEDAFKRAACLKIMARARPLDKQRLVKILQKRGEVVAVTGDGTNDAPALNFADVGLSMGTGTSVAKEASDITLLDDSFTSIANAVMWGRTVYLNIQRFVIFQLTINVAALVIVFLGSLLGFEMPLTVTQILWVNLIMDTFAAGALASLPPDPIIMNEKPRGLKSFIISPFMGKSILGTGLLFVAVLLGMLFYFNSTGEGISLREQSLFFTTFVILQFWNIFNAKAYKSGHSALYQLRKAPAFVITSIIILVGQIIIVAVGGEVFRVQPLEILDWVVIIAATSTVLWVGEIARYFARRKNIKK